MMKKLFRHNSSFLLLLGLITAFVAFVNGTDIYMAYQNAGKESESYKYKYNYYVEINGYDGARDLKESISHLPGNIDFGNGLLQVGQDCIHLSDIIYVYNEPFSFEIDILPTFLY